MSDLRIPMNDVESGSIVNITPASAGWQSVGFEVQRLRAGERLERTTDDREFCLVLISGAANVTTETKNWTGIGKRKNVFDPVPATSIYISRDDKFTLEAVTDVEVALCTAPGKVKRPARLIPPEKIETEHRGQGVLTRHVQNILSEQDEADNLLVVEVFVPGGHWSGFPPHKHDEMNLPYESKLEETYYFKFRPGNGSAWMKVYTEDGQLDESIAVREGDTVMVPRGYHPVCALPGYDCYFINVMAGPVRTWKFKTEPEHAWVLDWKS